jgi:hypothetical protein
MERIIDENYNTIDLYCRCPDGSYGFSCTEGFVNPCLTEGVQYFSADSRLSNTYFIECNWGIPYLFKCPRPLVWNQDIKVCDWDSSSEYGLSNQNVMQQQQYGSGPLSQVQSVSSSFESPIRFESQYQTQQNIPTKQLLSSFQPQSQPIQIQQQQQQQYQQPSSNNEPIVQSFQQTQELPYKEPSVAQQQRVDLFKSPELTYQQPASVQAVKVQPILRVNSPIYEAAPIVRVETVASPAPSSNETPQYQQLVNSIPEQTFASSETRAAYETPYGESLKVPLAEPQIMSITNFQKTLSPFNSIAPIQSVLQSQASYPQQPMNSRSSDAYNSVIRSILASAPKTASYEPSYQIYEKPQNPIQSFQSVRQPSPNLLNSQPGYDVSYGSSQSFSKSSTEKLDQCTCICNNDMNNPIRVANRNALLSIQN